MAMLKYVGPHDAVEVPHLNWQVFRRGEPVDVGDADLGNFHEQDCWEIDGVVGVAPEPQPAPPVPTTTGDNQPTEPAIEPAAPAEGN